MESEAIGTGLPVGQPLAGGKMRDPKNACLKSFQTGIQCADYLFQFFSSRRSGIDARLKPTNDKTVSGINARPTKS